MNKNQIDTDQASAGLMQVSTESVCSRDKVAFWADMVCQHLVQVECNSIASPEHFDGSISLRKVGNVDISQVVTDAQQVTRTSTLISKADSEYFMVNIQRHGNSAVQQDGRLTALKSGDIAIYSSTRKYDLSFNDEFSQTVLIFPADDLRLKIPGIDALTATALDSQNPAVQLFTRMTDSYFQTAFNALPSPTVEYAANALTELLAATVAVLSPAHDKNISNLTFFHLTRIKQYVADHLDEPELSIHSISKTLRIYPAHIHRLFEGELQTFSSWLWSCRLLACKRALESKALAHLTISEVAFQNGFNNSSHFSRAFRIKFGITPSECRDSRNLVRSV